MTIHTPITFNTSRLGHYAGFISRVLAFFIDVTIIVLVISLTTWFLSVTATMLQLKQIMGWILNYLPSIKSLLSALFSPTALFIYAFIFIVLYNVFFISVAGQTPGKALMGIRVVPLGGGKVSFWRATLRYIGYYLSGGAIGLGFLWILIDDRRMGWHDKIARTCVIYAWDARPDERFLVRAQENLDAQQNALSGFLSRGETIEEMLNDEQSDL
jgi:uncharacterized RDD family membrane protein YckC